MQITENRFIAFLSDALFVRRFTRWQRGYDTGLSKKHRCGKNSAGAKLALPDVPGRPNHNCPVTMPIVRRAVTGIHEVATRPKLRGRVVMSNDETKLYDEDDAVAEAGADGVPAGLDARGVGIRMAHATLSYVSLSSIEPNPFRDLKTYPYDKRKLEALERSIEHVGLWEGLIGRRAGHGYQLAFGHHRLEAARSRKLTTRVRIVNVNHIHIGRRTAFFVKRPPERQDAWSE
jgi:ParB-like nuclease domain